MIIDHISALSHWGIMFWATGLLLQGALVALVPEEVVMTALGLLWSQGKIPFWEAFVCIQVGLLPANVVMVLIGKHIGMPVLSRAPFSWILKPALIRAVLAPVRAHAKKVCFLTRFTPSIRGPVYFSLGLAGLKVKRFMVIDALASCVQIPCLLFLGRRIGRHSTSLIQSFQKLGVVLLVVIIVGFTLALIITRRREEKPAPAQEIA